MALKKAENNRYPGFSREEEGVWKQPFWFIQSADTQLGLIDNWNGVPEEQNTWDKDVELTNKAIDCVNVMQPRPKFMVICGDLVDAQPWKKRYDAQVADFKKCLARLDPEIPAVCVCGNHDVGDSPTQQTINSYKERFGDDYFTFWVGGVLFIVINSQYHKDASNVPKLLEEHDKWLDEQLKIAQTKQCKHAIIFQHIAWFLHKADEPEGYFNLGLEIRQKMLPKIKQAGIKYVFAGHYHRNAGGFDGDLEMVTSSAIGCQIGDDKSGMRIVRVFEDKLEHKYYNLENFPTEISLKELDNLP